jgi:acylphosphatase
MLKMKIRAHLFISGAVQGVFFRVETRKEAIMRNISGWIRNVSDGRVEAIFEGEKENVGKLITYCKRGPQGAEVTNIDVTWEEYLGKLKSFEIRKTTTQ